MGRILYEKDHSQEYTVLMKRKKELEELFRQYTRAEEVRSIRNLRKETKNLLEKEIREFLTHISNSGAHLYFEERDDIIGFSKSWSSILEQITEEIQGTPIPQASERLESMYTTLAESVSLEQAAELLGVSLEDLV